MKMRNWAIMINTSVDSCSIMIFLFFQIFSSSSCTRVIHRVSLAMFGSIFSCLQVHVCIYGGSDMGVHIEILSS